MDGDKSNGFTMSRYLVVRSTSVSIKNTVFHATKGAAERIALSGHAEN